LAGRSVCCGDECSCADGSSPVSCFADPCEVTPACSEADVCVANYCGGCNAEFYDASGYAVCQAPAACVDTLGFDFGPCDAVLGWSVQGDECVLVSGCSSPFGMFESEAECVSACPETAPAECASDSDCVQTGCSGQVCAPRPVITTCEWRDEYACYQDPSITTCGCSAGTCGFAQTPALLQCVAAGGPFSSAAP
jgi:eight-cysteine-cluster-containing protein